jgi:two-component system response regulator PilR (NtrC family)
LNVIEIVIPPLRERREDLAALCAVLLRRIGIESGIPVPTLPASVIARLAREPLPGNVRELENILQRAVALSDDDHFQIESSTGPAADAQSAAGATDPAPLDDDQITLPSDLQSHLDSQERNILIQALHQTGFNRTAAAARLGLSLRQMRYRIARLHIDTPHNGESPDEAA